MLLEPNCGPRPRLRSRRRIGLRCASTGSAWALNRRRRNASAAVIADVVPSYIARIDGLEAARVHKPNGIGVGVIKGVEAGNTAGPRKGIGAHKAASRRVVAAGADLVEASHVDLRAGVTRAREVGDANQPRASRPQVGVFGYLHQTGPAAPNGRQLRDRAARCVDGLRALALGERTSACSTCRY
jgi:hypothetical protein